MRRPMLAITCRMNKGSASCRLTAIRELTWWPMSPALSASARPKSRVNKDTERSQKIVSV